MKNSRRIKEFMVPDCELLLVLKAAAWESRLGSSKGRKDFLDIVSLLKSGECERGRINKWDDDETKKTINKLIELIKRTTQVKELGLKTHQTARLKTKWLDILG